MIRIYFIGAAQTENQTTFIWRLWKRARRMDYRPGSLSLLAVPHISPQSPRATICTAFSCEQSLQHPCLFRSWSSFIEPILKETEFSGSTKDPWYSLRSLRTRMYITSIGMFESQQTPWVYSPTIAVLLSDTTLLENHSWTSAFRDACFDIRCSCLATRQFCKVGGKASVLCMEIYAHCLASQPYSRILG